MRLDVLTIFPEYLEPLRHALLGKAIEQKILSIGVHDLRQWATDRHKSVDDTPMGGGPGMVMKPEVWGPALDDAAAGAGPVAETLDLTTASPHVDAPRHDELTGVDRQAYETDEEDRSKPLLLVPTPAGKPFTQADAQAWSAEEHIVFACGRYEGIDQRVLDHLRDSYDLVETSLGDYVLNGGEVAALAITEAVVRLLPGVVGNPASLREESHSPDNDSLLEYPNYTKPPVWRGREVPEILLSGNHARIAGWRREQALARTAERRPDLLK